MVWRYLKAQLLVLLFGGLVGPIFLICYLAFGREEGLDWMLHSGVLITGCDIVAAVLWAGYGARSARWSEFLEQHGVLALAEVVGIHETGTRVNDQPLVKLDLHIEGPGLTSFDTQDRVLASLNRLPVISGRTLAVLVDPATNGYRIDWERSALLSGTVPARFTLAEDNQTYDLAGQVGPMMEILQILRAHGVPVQGEIDIRSDPAVRQQVAAVVRRAAERSAEAAGPGGAASQSTGERLQELEALRKDGIVTDDEYRQKRQQIIADL
ncbi:SHOCT domain-containing protein [Mycobacterium sp. UM_Kg27]|uniref:SHOCT domain-containing protein n=1 Tax=Mycobacterium sp. UM_Kg27 TaxID=1545693 RepID=UPI00061AD559|nr:SHOCT domain-containing protein [Mycobacterium sp. UM_Kg27]